MAPQNISTENSSPISNMVIGLKFGGIIFYEKYRKNMDKFTTVGLSSNIIFGGATFMKGEKMKPRKCIYIGSMLLRFVMYACTLWSSQTRWCALSPSRC